SSHLIPAWPISSKAPRRATPSMEPLISTSEVTMPGAAASISNDFFRRYFGIGVEGFVLNAHRGAGFDLESNGVDVFIHEKRSESRAVGSVGNFYPSLSGSVFSFFPLRLVRRWRHLGRWGKRRNYF